MIKLIKYVLGGVFGLLVLLLVVGMMHPRPPAPASAASPPGSSPEPPQAQAQAQQPPSAPELDPAPASAGSELGRFTATSRKGYEGAPNSIRKTQVLDAHLASLRAFFGQYGNRVERWRGSIAEISAESVSVVWMDQGSLSDATFRESYPSTSTKSQAAEFAIADCVEFSAKVDPMPHAKLEIAAIEMPVFQSKFTSIERCR